jgi:hypothetical protein
LTIHNYLKSQNFEVPKFSQILEARCHCTYGPGIIKRYLIISDRLIKIRRFTIKRYSNVKNVKFQSIDFELSNCNKMISISWLYNCIQSATAQNPNPFFPYIHLKCSIAMHILTFKCVTMHIYGAALATSKMVRYKPMDYNLFDTCISFYFNIFDILNNIKSSWKQLIS